MRHDLEYGVIVDRTSQGLGYYIALTTGTQHSAEVARTSLERDYEGFPIAIKVRVVSRSAWEDLPAADTEPTP